MRCAQPRIQRTGHGAKGAAQVVAGRSGLRVFPAQYGDAMDKAGIARDRAFDHILKDFGDFRIETKPPRIARCGVKCIGSAFRGIRFRPPWNRCLA